MKLFENREFRNLCILAVMVSVSINSMFIIAEWYAVTPFGSDAGLWLSIFLVFPLLAVFLLGLFCIILTIFKRIRRIALTIILFCSIYFIVAFICMQIGEKIRMHAFHKLAQRSAPLINAIKKFDSDHGRPPRSLNEIVPAYLFEIPHTGIRAYPEYEYYIGGKAAQYEKNPWILMVFTPSGGIDFDIFIYFPKQNYPKYFDSGWFKRIDDWAYYHE
jgi:hypothetical protein